MVNQIECLYCHELFDFLPGVHLKREDHFGDRPDAFGAYKEWLASEHDLPRDHEVFQKAGALTRPEDFAEYKHLFE